MAHEPTLPASARVRLLNDLPARSGVHVLYWMQAAQRAAENPALEYAVERANELSLPLLVGFGLTDRYPEANLRHYTFMIEGLAQVRLDLERRGLKLAMLLAPPDEAALALGRRAAVIVTDRGHLRHHRRWRARVAAEAGCAVVQVETNLVVPVEEASNKSEWAAATFRPKLRRLLESYLTRTPEVPLRKNSLSLDPELPVVMPGPELVSRLRADDCAGPVSGFFRGGSAEGFRRLESFVAGPLQDYHTRRNDPGQTLQSGLSPYLHFGQISPITVAVAVQQASSVPEEAKAAFLEELVVRRELAFNFVSYEERYDSYDGLPEWARRTLDAHRQDPRPYVYSLRDLESAQTHDVYWNAAMNEMRITGSMHGYMRMYWGKKILEWSASPEEAFAAALTLNNRWFLDGRDPNSYAGVAWCFGKHDRPWPERGVYGKVRTMTSGGLRRKFDMDGYLRRIGALKP